MKSAKTIDFLKPKNLDSAAGFIAAKINQHLANDEKVLWLVSGGSAIKLAVETARLLAKNPHLKNLTVTLADERWGKPGHSNSNWNQLMEADFRLPEAKLQPVLQGKDLESTALDYAQNLQADIEWSDYSLAIAGIGPDGHTFGIKPASPAVESTDLVIGFKWDDYDRLTPTANLIEQLNEIMVYAYGEEKRAELDKLEQDLPLASQPAQVLKRVNKLTILNDYKGEEI